MNSLATNIVLLMGFLVSKTFVGQCPKDSNYYSITYTGANANYVKEAVTTSQNEMVALLQSPSNSTFVTKFTSDGNVIWSNEYAPNYPLLNWYSYPWYEKTQMEGMIMAKDSTLYIYGSTYEHGRSVSGGEDPPSHWAGLILHIDKFGSVISGRYVGNWRTDYTINGLIQLDNGNLIVYLRSLFFPYTSKLLCIDDANGIIWATPLQPNYLYSEVAEVKPVLKQLSNANIVVANGMVRNLADTLIQPWQPIRLFLPPLYYFNLFELDGKTGKLLWQRSSQCPSLTGTHVTENFIPRIKSIAEVPGGNLSFCADMYWPTDNLMYWAHQDFSKRTINFIANSEGYFIKLYSYHQQGGSGSFQNASLNGNRQVLLAKDTTNRQLVVVDIDENGQISSGKSFTSATNAELSTGFVLQKKNNGGYFIFDGDPFSSNFHLNITNAVGNNPCLETPVTLMAEDFPWPWFVNKVHYRDIPPDADMRYSPFNFSKKSYPLAQNTNCRYQYTCCSDFIDTLHTHNISICENETYTLPDNSIVETTGRYYVRYNTEKGCDSIVFYNIRVLKSPSHLAASPDTCMESATRIQLKATGGYDSYVWSGLPTNDSFYTVHTPGTYTVTVENICGSKTDTINVYDRCNFPVYFPTAFTPNGDLVNDILKVPEANKNKFRRLSIYNRWGQLLFSSSSRSNGWDGRFNGMAQPTGVYVYILEMETLSCQKVNQKGTVALIR
ncbi:MAG TPA: gliding motility-associated C-terminal domain-containing protein [Chitinophagaceae bacterium]|nr:gliding motility-associated C-terminal domain-containing protein [Chitinophagaceae bacterium]